jgi:hypothetical protein
LISSRNPSPKSPSPEVVVPQLLAHIPAHGNVLPERRAVDPERVAPEIVWGAVDPERSIAPDDVLVFPAIGHSGAIGSPLRKLAIDLALAFFVPVYGYFSLKIIVLIRVISARRS